MIELKHNKEGRTQFVELTNKGAEVTGYTYNNGQETLFLEMDGTVIARISDKLATFLRERNVIEKI